MECSLWSNSDFESGAFHYNEVTKNCNVGLIDTPNQNGFVQLIAIPHFYIKSKTKRTSKL